MAGEFAQTLPSSSGSMRWPIPPLMKCSPNSICASSRLRTLPAEATRYTRGRPFGRSDPSTLARGGASSPDSQPFLLRCLSADMRRAPQSLGWHLTEFVSNAAAADGLRKLAGAIAAPQAATNFDAAAKLLGVDVPRTVQDRHDAVAFDCESSVFGFIRRPSCRVAPSRNSRRAFWRLSAANTRRIECLGEVFWRHHGRC